MAKKKTQKSTSAVSILKEIHNQQFGLRKLMIEVKTGQRRDVSIIAKTKREIARLYTNLHQIIAETAQKGG